ncbi:hypothetical protein LTR56_005571 [Elasticomyces elasticus]|nr:hypothetical protein LTR22_017158 [Elasticomyces elasticus]KAK3651763.1 hypothetical protein LTR56_005571 [Elasticomyces elasticus]KAK4913332.1 hypothetical protein LTR49_018313 [Elasticomyces elasticus]KAK5769138.1 hypothetical protein LTS12_000489 [Elasticomyces elasticus]
MNPSTQPRRVLATVSPNLPLAPAVQTLKAVAKPIAGSPLKRSFTAMRAEDPGVDGLMYLKRRKLDTDETLSQGVDSERARRSGSGNVISPTRSVFEAGREATRAATASLSPEAVAETPAITCDPEPSPTEPNTPSDTGEPETELSHAHPAPSQPTTRPALASFSSLINFDPSSQVQPQTTQLTLSPATLAETLRLRLRVAMYKVRTNQISTPFSRLRVPDPSSNAKTRTVYGRPLSAYLRVAKDDNLAKATAEAVEEAVAELRREAQALYPPPSHPTKEAPKLLGAVPVLLPTAFNSRWVYGTERLPSSPPRNSISPTKLSLSPEVTRYTGAHSPRRPARRDYVAGSPERVLRSSYEEQELTSSVVKAKVAQSLMGLRGAA